MEKFKKFIILGVFVLGVSGVLYSFSQAVLEVVHFPILSWTEDPTGDCVVVLTGGQNRLREGLDLLARAQTKKLIVAGVLPKAGLREIFPLWSFQGILSEHDVILERRSTTTYGNAQQTLPIVEALGCREVILITSNFHMSRALKTFQSTYPSEINLIPYSIYAGQSEAEWQNISTEALKSLFYGLWAYSNIAKIFQN